jgi:hypothetical protein
MSKASRSFSTIGSWNYSKGNVRNGCVSWATTAAQTE